MNNPLLANRTSRSRPPRIFATILLLAGVALAAGGLRLITLGGSFYYAISGSVLIASGVLLWRGSRWGAHLYGVLTFGTVLWALAEAGFDGWALAPRVLPFLVLGLLLLRPGVRRALFGQPRPLFSTWIICGTPRAWPSVTSASIVCGATRSAIAALSSRDAA